jgi:hypothetical protein
MEVLTDEEQALLLEVIGHDQQVLRPLVDELIAGPLRLTASEGNALRDAVGKELARTGFGTDWEPNDRGLDLEGLIDKLGRVTAVFD